MAGTSTRSFIPKGQQGLLLRNPLTQGHIEPLSMYRPKSQLFPRDIRNTLQSQDAHRLYNSSIGKSMGFYARHNPHPVRVRHMKGLLDIPICVVEDNIERRILWSAPTGEDFSIHYRPQGHGRYSANINKHIPAVGIVPVTYTWRDELERKTQNAINKVLGKSPPSRLSSRSMRNRATNDFDHVEDEQLLELLCRILQTESIPTCQAWLNSATETEKTIVMNMLRMAATGEIEANLTRTSSRPSTKEGQQQTPTVIPQVTEQAAVDSVAADKLSSTLPFEVPEHDTVIRSAHSRLASRQSNRPGSAFHQTLQEELDQQADRLSVQLKSSSRRPRSSSVTSRPNTASENAFQTQKSRTRSWNTALPPKQHEVHLPPPPVKVTISKETLNMTPSSSKNYTSKWTNSQ